MDRNATIALVGMYEYSHFMPKLIDLATCSIHMHAADHLPPHFHVRMNDGREALVEIATLEVLRGNVPQREMRPATA